MHMSIPLPYFALRGVHLHSPHGVLSQVLGDLKNQTCRAFGHLDVNGVQNGGQLVCITEDTVDHGSNNSLDLSIEGLEDRGARELPGSVGLESSSGNRRAGPVDERGCGTTCSAQSSTEGELHDGNGAKGGVEKGEKEDESDSRFFNRREEGGRKMSALG